VLLRLEKGGKGKTVYAVGGDIEFIAVNSTDPNTEVDGERSSMKTKHPILSDAAVRKALALLVDRNAIQKVIYGRAGRTTANYLNGPAAFASKNTSWEFSVEKASKLLDDAGWKLGADGIREKDGKKLKLLYQTSTNGPRQKTQAIVKQACQKAGIDVELKSVVGSVFFSSDINNPDTYPHFYCDAQMYNTTMTQPDAGFFMNQYLSWQVATKENKWQGRNVSRWHSKEYDDIHKQADEELDAVKRAAMYIKLNDLVVSDNYIQPLLRRPKVSAVVSNLKVPLSGWDNDLWQITNWYKET
jgi:peptide/nickel transport system substrate-binding protein